MSGIPRRQNLSSDGNIYGQIYGPLGRPLMKIECSCRSFSGEMAGVHETRVWLSMIDVDREVGGGKRVDGDSGVIEMKGNSFPDS